MRTLLVLGSKPDPALPGRESIAAVACANASGHSAAAAGLPTPLYTVITAVLGAGLRGDSGKRTSNRLALEAMRGLATHRVYFLPRPWRDERSLKARLRRVTRWRMSAWYLRRCLRQAGYAYEEFVDPGYRYFVDTVARECAHDPEVLARMAEKQPSTGAFAVALGLADPEFDRVVVAGFSFELTHAYAHNPTIDELGTTRSKHAQTDVAVLHGLSRVHGDRLMTTEPAVAEATGIPYL